MLLWLVDAAQLLFLPLSTSPVLDWTAAPLAVNGLYTPLLPLTFLPGVRARNSDTITFTYGALALFVAATVTALTMVRTMQAGRSRGDGDWLLRMHHCLAADPSPTHRAQLGLFAWSVAIHTAGLTYRPMWRVALLHWLLLVAVQGFALPLLAGLAAPWGCRTKQPWDEGGMMVRPLAVAVPNGRVRAARLLRLCPAVHVPWYSMPSATHRSASRADTWSHSSCRCRSSRRCWRCWRWRP